MATVLWKDCRWDYLIYILYYRFYATAMLNRQFPVYGIQFLSNAITHNEGTQTKLNSKIISVKPKISTKSLDKEAKVDDFEGVDRLDESLFNRFL